MKPFLWVALLLIWPPLQPQAASARPRWQGPPFFVITRGMAVADILRDFGSNYRVPVVISEQIEDRFVGTLRHADPMKLLHQLASLYNLVWYYDGEAIYVYIVK